MNKEEAIKYGTEWLKDEYLDARDGAFIEIALEALKREPCEDAISRQAVLDILKREGRKWGNNYRDWVDAIEEIKNLSSVNPTKTGHWIETAEEYYKAVNEYGGGVNENTPYFVDDIACSECLAKYSVLDNETQFFKHCPNCGAWMVEPQERSKKE